MPYNFNPKEFKFHEINKHPEIFDFFGKDTFIKVTAEHKSEKGNIYWYLAIKKIRDDDDRLNIYSGSFKENETVKEHQYPHKVYSGLISNDEFAKNLLIHLMGTTLNSGVHCHGILRFNSTCLRVKE